MEILTPPVTPGSIQFTADVAGWASPALAALNSVPTSHSPGTKSKAYLSRAIRLRSHLITSHRRLRRPTFLAFSLFYQEICEIVVIFHQVIDNSNWALPLSFVAITIAYHGSVCAFHRTICYHYCFNQGS